MDLREETRGVVLTYKPESTAQTARTLREIWSQVPSTEAGAPMVKAELREQLTALGVPVPALKEIGREIGKADRQNVNSFLPLARDLWDEYGREDRLVASTFLGSMELTAPDRVIPVIGELAESCVTWEDCDQLAMSALEPVVRKEPARHLDRLQSWVQDPNKWVRRAAITAIGRLPMKQPSYTERCLLLIEPALGDDDLDVRRAVSFTVRMAARAAPTALVGFVGAHAQRTDPASIWVLCDAMRSMTKKLLPQFKGLLPIYDKWLATVDSRSRRSAIKALESVSDP